MALGNTTLWGDILPGGVDDTVAANNLDTAQVIDDLLPSLHAASRADLTFWTSADLIQWMDEALKRLARVACVFAGRSASILTVAGQAAYTLPPRHISTLHMSHLVTAMRPAGTIEMEALNPAYQTTQGTPRYWYEDLQGADSVGVAPVPDTSDEAMPVIYEGYPATLDAGGQDTLVAGPPPLKGYLAMCVLAEAYGRESEAESPDIAAHCRGRMAMYEQIFQGYYGAGM